MTRRTVYVAAPLSAPTARERAHNVARASALVSMLHREGRAPTCVHSLVEAGAYGDDADPEARAKGLETAVALAVACLDIFVLLRDDGTLSDGCRAEYGEWCDYDGDSGALRETFAWADLRARMEAVRLGDVWARLRIGPDVAGPWVRYGDRIMRWFGGVASDTTLAALVARESMWSDDGKYGWEAWRAPGDETIEGGDGTDCLTEADAMAAADAWLRAHGVEVDDG